MAPCLKAPSLTTSSARESAHDAFDLRQRSDYAAEYQVSVEDAEMTLKNSELFVDEAKKYLSK